jgi:hypothetical protein
MTNKDKPKNLAGKTAPVPLRPPRILHDVTQGLNRGFCSEKHSLAPVGYDALQYFIFVWIYFTVNWHIGTLAMSAITALCSADIRVS